MLRLLLYEIPPHISNPLLLALLPMVLVLFLVEGGNGLIIGPCY